MRSPVVVVALFMVPLVYGARADACGGLFCSQTSPTPVDQSAERILFEVQDDGSVAATVEIKYNGDPRAFSWIVPVTGTPAFVDVGSKDELNLLDNATRLTITPPTSVCSHPPPRPLFGCYDSLEPLAERNLDGDLPGGGTGGVGVTAYPSVGPFDEIVVVDGGDPVVLMQWLSDHGYQVTDKMKPYIEQYTVEGYKFLATKLQPDTDVQDMAPIRFQCPQPYPEIPLRLTAIAAEPEMGFLVFVAGAQRYTPANYAEVKIDPADVRVLGGTSNYFPLVSKRLDEAGGLGFVVERAASSTTIRTAVDATQLGTDGDGDAHTAVDAILDRRAYVTRFYARLNPDEMVEDPQFIPGINDDFDGTYDLSGRQIDLCPASGTPVTSAPSCGLTYCGDGDACAPTDSGDACVCRNNHVARAASSPTGGVAVECMAPVVDVHGSGANPCEQNDCGLGTCLPVNDRATCQCQDGAAAIATGGNGVVARVQCVAMTGAVIESDQIVWKESPPGDEPAGCTAPFGDRVGGSLSIALLFLSSLALRLRRR